MKYNPDLHNRHSIRMRKYDYTHAGAYFITICCQNRINYFGEIFNKEMVLNEYGNIAHKEWKKLSERYPGIKFDIFQIMPNHIHGIIKIHDTNVGATFTVAPNADTVAPNPNDTPTPNAGMTIPNANTSIPNADIVAPNTAMAASNADMVATNADMIPQNVDMVAPTAFGYGATVKVAPTVGTVGCIVGVTVGRIVGAYKSLVLKKCLEISNMKNCILGKLWQRNYYEHIIRDETEYAKIVEYIRKNPILYKIH